MLLSLPYNPNFVGMRDKVENTSTKRNKVRSCTSKCDKYFCHIFFLWEVGLQKLNKHWWRTHRV